MEHDTKVTGKMTCNMVMVLKPGPMDQNMKVIIAMERSMAKGLIFGLTVVDILETGLTIK